MSEGNDLRRGVGVGFRLGAELTVSTLVGAVMGYALDWFLGTKPWLMVLGVFFGDGECGESEDECLPVDSPGPKPPAGLGLGGVNGGGDESDESGSSCLTEILFPFSN